MIEVRVTSDAEVDIKDALDWYARESGIPPVRFRDAIETAVGRIAQNYQQFPVVHRNVRRALLRGFPYGVFFVMQRESAVIVACMHCSRHPRNWQRRRS